MTEEEPPAHSTLKEPKFCRCRVCHEHFYASTIDKAREECMRHGREQHPDWGDSACYCPD